MIGARKLNEAARKTLAPMAPDTDPMDVLRTVLSAQAAARSLTKPSVAEAMALTAVIPTIVAGAYRRRQKKDLMEPRDELGHAANLLWMMDAKEPATERVRWLDSYLVLLADHGLHASTFTARVIASTGSDLASCVVGAVGALKGPAHGGATYAARTMLDNIGSVENVEKWLGEQHAKHARFSGFRHRVYLTYYPRAKLLPEMANAWD